jgi:hypothetical protein
MKNQFFLRGDIKWKNGMKCLVELQSNMELIRNRCTSLVWIKAIDLNDQVHSGDTNVLLGTVTLTGKKAGTTDLGISHEKIDNETAVQLNTV